MSAATKTIDEMTPQEFVEQVVLEIRRLAETYPDFVYDKPGTGCSNLYGGDPKYPELKGCIVGQAVINLGFEIPASRSCAAAYDLMKLIKPELIPFGNDIVWIADVQCAQDKGYCWRDAIRKADKSYLVAKDSDE